MNRERNRSPKRKEWARKHNRTPGVRERDRKRHQSPKYKEWARKRRQNPKYKEWYKEWKRKYLRTPKGLASSRKGSKKHQKKLRAQANQQDMAAFKFQISQILKGNITMAQAEPVRRPEVVPIRSRLEEARLRYREMDGPALLARLPECLTRMAEEMDNVAAIFERLDALKIDTGQPAWQAAQLGAEDRCW